MNLNLECKSTRTKIELFEASRAYEVTRILLAGACLDSQAEEARLEEHLNGYAESEGLSTHPFWSDRARGLVLAKLQDRAWQAAILLEVCRSSLARVYQAMFPLNEQPQGLAALVERFREGKAMKRFVREQLICVANVALAFVRSHLPDLDLKKIALGPAPVPGGGPVPMQDHYQATRTDALVLVHRVLKEQKKWAEPKEESA